MANVTAVKAIAMTTPRSVSGSQPAANTTATTTAKATLPPTTAMPTRRTSGTAASTYISAP